MRLFGWDEKKNDWLKANRQVSFEEVVFHIQEGDLLDDIGHPNPQKLGHQRMLVVKMENYVFLVPYVENEKEIFLKTVIPSRKATQKYLIEEKHDD